MRRIDTKELDDQAVMTDDDWPVAYVLHLPKDVPDHDANVLAERVREEILHAIHERRPPILILAGPARLEVIYAPRPVTIPGESP